MLMVIDIISEMRGLDGSFPKREQRVADYILQIWKMSRICRKARSPKPRMFRSRPSAGSANRLGAKDFGISKYGWPKAWQSACNI